jgi:hypothetical protein
MPSRIKHNYLNRMNLIMIPSKKGYATVMSRSFDKTLKAITLWKSIQGPVANLEERSLVLKDTCAGLLVGLALTALEVKPVSCTKHITASIRRLVILRQITRSSWIEFGLNSCAGGRDLDHDDDMRGQKPLMFASKRVHLILASAVKTELFKTAGHRIFLSSYSTTNCSDGLITLFVKRELR